MGIYLSQNSTGWTLKRTVHLTACITQLRNTVVQAVFSYVKVVKMVLECLYLGGNIDLEYINSKLHRISYKNITSGPCLPGQPYLLKSPLKYMLTTEPNACNYFMPLYTNAGYWSVKYDLFFAPSEFLLIFQYSWQISATYIDFSALSLSSHKRETSIYWVLNIH